MKPTKDEIEEFGKWLAEARSRRGITIDELASYTKVSRSTIINLEQKKAKGLNSATKLAFETYFNDKIAVGTLKSMNNSGLEHLRELFSRIAEIVLSKDFFDRVNGATEILRVSKKEAVIYILEIDLKK